MQRPFRFGVNTTDIESRAAWQDRARRLEADGWSTLLVPDHFGGVSTFAPLVSAADATSTLRVGSLVVNNDLFHPLRLAQEVVTIDLLTDGRLELGLGSGWNKPEYELLELSYDKPAQRAARLRDGVAAMKSAWAGEALLAGGPGPSSPPARIPDRWVSARRPGRAAESRCHPRVLAPAHRMSLTPSTWPSP